MSTALSLAWLTTAHFRANNTSNGSTIDTTITRRATPTKIGSLGITPFIYLAMSAGIILAMTVPMRRVHRKWKEGSPKLVAGAEWYMPLGAFEKEFGRYLRWDWSSGPPTAEELAARGSGRMRPKIQMRRPKVRIRRPRISGSVNWGWPSWLSALFDRRRRSRDQISLHTLPDTSRPNTSRPLSGEQPPVPEPRPPLPKHPNARPCGGKSVAVDQLPLNHIISSNRGPTVADDAIAVGEHLKKMLRVMPTAQPHTKREGQSDTEQSLTQAATPEVIQAAMTELARLTSGAQGNARGSRAVTAEEVAVLEEIQQLCSDASLGPLDDRRARS